MNDDYFVKIEEPQYLHKSILVASKQLLQMTKSQIQMKKFLEKKESLKINIRKELVAITQTVVKLQERLPHADLVKEFDRDHPKPTAPVHVPFESKRISSEEEKLEQAITAIEKKLASLK